MNAGTRETYAKVHRTKPEDFDRVWENIAEATKRKGGCTIGVQMVMLPENEREVDDLYARASVAEVDYVVLKPYSQHKFSLTREYEPFRPATFMHMEITDHKPFLYVRSDVPSHEPPRYTRCHSTPNFWAYVMASGDVYSCSAYLLDERFNLGNIAVESFPAIWRGEGRRRNFELLKTLDIGECRKNCRMHKANEYLWDLAQGIPHQNFV